MFRHLLEEAFEEFKQNVAPARPEISFPQPPGTYPLPAPSEMPEMMDSPGPRRARQAPEPTRLRETVRGQAQQGSSGVRSQLATRSSLRSAFQMMEVLGPPVSLRDPGDREPGW